MSNPRAKFEKAELIKAARRDFEFLQTARENGMEREHESGGVMLGPGGIATSTVVKRIRDNLDQAKVGLEVLVDGATPEEIKRKAQEVDRALMAASGGNLDRISDLAAADRGNMR